MVWFTNGLGINVIDFEEYAIKPNRLFIVKPKQVHNWSYSKDTKGYIIVFDKHFIQNFSIELLNSAIFDIKSKNITFFKILFEKLIEDFSFKDKLSEKTVAFGINYIIQQLRRLAPNIKYRDKAKTTLMFDFSKLISTTVSENIPVKEYADRLSITVEKLNELCKESFGQNPKTIILDRKITEAKRLLYFTDLTVKEIAYRLGFEDSSYFSRIFKQKTNLSPSGFKSKSD